ncbi:MAG: hypothetical protein KDK54_19600 [Leptospiraceae bacterium]|nr:hypothetical protein [Leptospiraceae bacterium]
MNLEELPEEMQKEIKDQIEIFNLLPTALQKIEILEESVIDYRKEIITLDMNINLLKNDNERLKRIIRNLNNILMSVKGLGSYIKSEAGQAIQNDINNLSKAIYERQG